MTKIERIEIYGIIVLEMVTILAGVYGIITWSNWRDEKVMQAAEAYEECVEKQYHTTPSDYRAEHGEYPVCNTK